ncbi:MAG: FHA domain-containing protein [Planctomycetota bacterium]|nr:MAG: FHA domain-containing protein [Planctomycetota bacterium]
MQWESLRLFVMTHGGIEKEEFLNMYNVPVLVQQKRRGVPIKVLYQIPEAREKIIQLDKLERLELLKFEGAKDIQDVFLFLPFGKGKEEIFIGSDSSNDIPMNLPWTSSRHAKISKNHMGLYTLTDLDSKEGTYLNEKKLYPGVDYPIGDFNQIVFGKSIKFFFLTPHGLFDYLRVLANI